MQNKKENEALIDNKESKNEGIQQISKLQYPQFNQNSNTGENIKYLDKKSKKIGLLIAGIICTILGIGFTIWAIYNSINPFIQGGDYSMLAFVIFMIVGGFLIFLPALGFSIAGITCSALAIKSCNKHIKHWSIFFLVLAIVTLIIIIIAPFVIPYIVQSAQPTT